MNVSLDENAILPVREHSTDAGIDLFTPVALVVPAHGFAFVDTGVHVQLPENTRGHVCSKSGLNKNFGITVDGTIDQGYTGSVGVTVHNDGDTDYVFRCGDRIAQLVVEMVLYPEIIQVDRISGGERGDSGFGSTGR